MFEPEFDREQLRKFNKKSYRSVAARYAQSAELMLVQLEAENERLRELLMEQCNCENELPPCKICYVLGGES